MRPHLYTLLAAIIMLCGIEASAQTLAEFNLNNYEGWVYNRSDVELTRQNISYNRIRLYGDFSLESPLFACDALDSVKVTVVYATATTDYDAGKIALTCQLVDETGNVVSATTIGAQKRMVEQDMTGMLAVAGQGMQRLRLLAPKADINNNAAVRSVKVNGVILPTGDLTGDNTLDVADVSSTVNLIISSFYDSRADMNLDGIIDIVDVNLMLNKILK